MNALDAARRYVADGCAVVPVPHKSKGLYADGWQDMRLTQVELPQYFNGRPQNVGILTGAPSRGLVDVDQDCLEARVAASFYLPTTQRVSGRAGAPASHVWYRTTPIPDSAKYRDPLKRDDDARQMLIELRSTGCQTIVPPSVHPSGKDIVWHSEGAPAEVDGRILLQIVAKVAAAALLARYWPGKGSRHDAALALAGWLQRQRWQQEDAELFVEAVATAAGDDEAKDRVAAVESTFCAALVGRHTTGFRALCDVIDWRVLKRAAQWLGIDQRPDDPLIEDRGAVPPVRALHVSIERVPPLPEVARLAPAMRDAAHQARSVWLDPFVCAAKRLSPRTPRTFIEAAGIFALFASVARRVYVRAGPKKLYPVALMMLVGRSTLTSKTTIIELLRQLLKQAGLGDLLLPSTFTAQALLADLAAHVPQAIREGSTEEQARWLERHRHAAQRAIIRDEVSGLLDDFSRDYQTGLLPFLLKLADAPDDLDSDITISRGLVEVHNLGVSLFGATTPAALREHAAKSQHWSSGMFGRWALVAPDESPTWSFWREEEFPFELVQMLRATYDALPPASAAYTFTENEKGDSRISGCECVYRPIQAHVAPDARDAWQRYDKAIYGLAARPDAPERLDATYGRLPSLTMRVALALATADWARRGNYQNGAPTVGIGHWAAAQEIAEGWRAGAHKILAAAMRDEEAETTHNLAERLVRALQAHGGRAQRGDVLKQLNWKAAELDKAVAAASDRVSEATVPGPGRPARWLELMHEEQNTGSPDKGTKGTKAADQVTEAGTLVVGEGTKVPVPPEGADFSAFSSSQAQAPDDLLRDSHDDRSDAPSDGVSMDLGKARIDRTRLQELIDWGVPTDEARERARTDYVEEVL